MSPSRSHDIVANRIAKKFGTDYNKGPGPDINKPAKAVEVEPEKTVKDGIRQLQGFKKPVYIAGSNQEAVDAALRVTKGTTVGVMDEQGNVVKSSSRKK